MQVVESVKPHLVCAIIAPNYASQALVLGRSIAKGMPDTEFRVLLLQDCTDVGPIQAIIDAYLREEESEEVMRRSRLIRASRSALTSSQPNCSMTSSNLRRR